MRGGTSAAIHIINSSIISIHPPLAGRDVIIPIQGDCSTISIHPPLAGRDLTYNFYYDRLLISIHPPLAGRDLLQRT